MGRDLISNPYGRFYYLPQALARKGHEVHIALCSYHREADIHGRIDIDGVTWSSFSLINGNPLKYYWQTKMLARKFMPEVIVGFSDTYYGILAHHLARRYSSKSLIDAYDNYESYLAWCKPLHSLWRHALAVADVITAAGPQLMELMSQGRAEGKFSEIIPMAADPNGFRPLDKIECRRRLGLPLDRKLVGYCGSIHKTRGMEVLFEAYKAIVASGEEIELILTGRKFPDVILPAGARWLGYLPDDQMPFLLNSMDVLAVMSTNSAFGAFSYPVKLYEAMCCQVPIVASHTPAIGWILRDHPDQLVSVGNHLELSRKLLQGLTLGPIDYGQREGWSDVANELEELFVALLS
ncbi:MAG: glycosyltransferase family 4 protein [Proteobacteria bacterium]|nr:glycosyltransferase family 4 protein [Pseudomonadota bacterium]MBU1688682.1 glycosyltransferase family 4 protein [Pseudomonadota bacterium]